MVEKSVAQMKKELQEFYFKKVKDYLPEINRIRKHERVNTICMLFVFLSMAAIFVLGNLKLEKLTFIFVVILVLSMAVLMFNNKNSKSKSVTIDVSGESAVKGRLMNDFLKIFGDNFKWSKNDSNNNIRDFLMGIAKLNIMGGILIGNIDDTIVGKYMGVNFRILEFDTSLSLHNVMAYLALAPFLIGCGCSMFMVFVFIVIIISTIINVMWLFWLIPAVIVLLLLILIYSLLTYVPFRGVFVEFDMNKNFEGHTFLIENAPSNRGINFNHADFGEVKLEDVEFNRKYKTYSTDQVEARFVLTTAFIERFKNMKTAFKAKYIRAAFKDKKITIAIDAGKDLFAMANLNKDTDAQTFVELFNEILSVLALIQALKLNQKIGL